MGNKELIGAELSRRLDLWKEINKFPSGEVDWKFLEQKKIIAGQRGVYRNKEVTGLVSKGRDGVTIAVRHRGGKYPDELSDDGIIYHYPETKKEEHDLGEINATKEAISLNLPIFIVLEGNTSSTKEVKLGWVLDFDDRAKVFLIDFGEERPPLNISLDDKLPFELVDRTAVGKSLTKTRPNQRKFRYALTKNYDYKCAVCSIEIPELLQACHIRGKENKGSDDWRNGMFLCLNHHAAFDNNLLTINPNDYSVKPKVKNLKIEEKFLSTKTGKTPHIDALNWKWKNRH